MLDICGRGCAGNSARSLKFGGTGMCKRTSAVEFRMVPVRYGAQLIQGICYAGVVVSCIVRCEAVMVPIRHGMLPIIHDGAMMLVCVGIAERSYFCKVRREDCNVLEIYSIFDCED